MSVLHRVLAYFDPRDPLQDEKGQIPRNALVRLNDLVDRTGGERGDFTPLQSRTVAQLQALTPPGPAIGFCSNEAGGATLVFYEPVAGEWRRVSDLAAIS